MTRIASAPKVPMNLNGKLAPFGGLEWHKTYVLEIVQGLACVTVEHVTAAIHLRAIKRDVSAVILKNAIGEGACDEVHAVEFHRLVNEDFAFDDLQWGTAPRSE